MPAHLIQAMPMLVPGLAALAGIAVLWLRGRRAGGQRAAVARRDLAVALALLDQWLSGHDTSAPPGLAGLTRLPAGHWTGERAARDVLTLARKGRAFASLDALIARQGGQHVLYGSALVLAVALQAWARPAGTPLIDLACTVVR